MAVHRMSEVKPGRMVVTLDGKESCLPVRHGGARTTRHGLPVPTVEILDWEPAGRGGRNRLSDSDWSVGWRWNGEEAVAATD